MFPFPPLLFCLFLLAATPPFNLTTHQKTWKGVWLRNDSEWFSGASALSPAHPTPTPALVMLTGAEAGPDKITDALRGK